MTRPDYDLIRFVRQLHNMNSDQYELMSNVQRDRCQRWLDSVLPPTDDSVIEGMVYFPYGLSKQEKAAE